MKLGQFKTIAEPDPPACWLYKNVRVKGYVGEVDLPTDQYIRRDIDMLFQEACTSVRMLLPDGRDALIKAAPFTPATPPVMLPVEALTDENCSPIVEAYEIDDYGSMLFKFRFWGIPER